MPTTVRITRGGVDSPIKAETLSAVVAGQPVYMTAAAKWELAEAGGTSLEQAVVGLTRYAAAAANPVLVITEGQITKTDWTPVTGTVSLTPGATYYLDTTAGRLSTTAPSGSGEYIRRVGKAVGNQTLDIEIAQSILLT